MMVFETLGISFDELLVYFSHSASPMRDISIIWPKTLQLVCVPR